MQKNQNYTAEVKAEAVKLVLEQKAAEPSVGELKVEVSRLRRELARVEMEREIVNRAAGTPPGASGRPRPASATTSG